MCSPTLRDGGPSAGIRGGEADQLQRVRGLWGRAMLIEGVSSPQQSLAGGGRNFLASLFKGVCVCVHHRFGDPVVPCQVR